MTAKRRADHLISSFQAFVFAVVLGLGLILVLAPVLPGDAPLEAGDRAFKTFSADGQVIAEKGEAVTQADLAKIRAEGLLGNEMSFGGALAALLASVLGAGALGLYLYLFQPKQAAGVPRLFMVGMLVLFWVAAAKVFLSLTLPDSDRLYLGYILPVAAAPMLIATLLDGSLGVAVAGLIALLAAFAGFAMPDARVPLASAPLDPLQMAFAYLFAGVAGVYAVRRAERVNAYVMAGLAVGLVTFWTLLTFWLLNPEREGVDLVWMTAASAMGGFGSAVVTVGGTVVLGLMFGVTTRIQLMELAQLSHPLLRQLQEKAPGTFHHSVIVGNLGERAADLVGADPLLVRVGCYFHDIGKIARPGYYIENQTDAANPHDRLDPSASAKLVADHVKAGVELTAKYRVPGVVRAFVPEHHGTRLITYFYRKASAADPTVDPEKFRYPGPKPQSRETAIVMLSDSVEAVVRSSKDRSFERIDELVDSVIAERVAEGQLDECNLTLRDIKVIGESFKSTLRGIYHPRIEYPAPTRAELQTAGVAFIQPPSSPMEPPPIESKGRG
jgi:putative nucleotidyltransferase with HDIG domain